jgi:branched-chain amino acid transport system ATP-binding protein
VTARLEVRDLRAGYEAGLDIVTGASLTLDPGQILALLGPNGAGKSTLVKALAGLVPLRAGTVRLGGEDIAALPTHERIGRGVAYVPQSENVFLTMSIRENLELAGFRLGRARRRRVAAMLAFFPDLADRPERPAGRLSGGQRQMLAIAMALLVKPRVLMLDEPSAGLSPRLVAAVLDKLGEIRAGGTAILLVEQNVDAALRVADRAVVLVEGRERHVGPAATLRGSRLLAELFLGPTA